MCFQFYAALKSFGEIFFLKYIIETPAPLFNESSATIIITRFELDLNQ